MLKISKFYTIFLFLEFREELKKPWIQNFNYDIKDLKRETLTAEFEEVYSFF